jgi:hypothetical protein
LRSNQTMPTDFRHSFIEASQKHPELGIVFQSAYDLVLRPYLASSSP